VDDTGIFGIMLIIAVILLVCILILYEHQRRLADALNILMLIWISIAESGILTAKSQNTMASIVALVCLALTVIAALIVYQADEYSTILPSSFLGAAVCGLLGGWFFPYNLDDDPSKIFFLMLGIEIVLTAVGCLLQIFILE
jgi:membrane-associated HD superfamily phosphohydrolase